MGDSEHPWAQDLADQCGRLTERDKIKMGECFRLGDIVKAKVVSDLVDFIWLQSLSNCCGLLSTTHEILKLIRFLQLSLGDARSYYLSTAANELGVLYANSEAGMLGSFLDITLIEVSRLTDLSCALSQAIPSYRSRTRKWKIPLPAKRKGERSPNLKEYRRNHPSSSSQDYLSQRRHVAFWTDCL